MSQDSSTGGRPSDADCLHLAGVALGILAMDDAWQKRHSRQMGELLSIAERTVERWASGARDVPPAVWRDIAVWVRARAEQVAKLAADLDARSPPL